MNAKEKIKTLMVTDGLSVSEAIRKYTNMFGLPPDKAIEALAELQAPPELSKNIYEGLMSTSNVVVAGEEQIIIDRQATELKSFKEDVANFNKGWKAAQNGEPKGDRMDEEQHGWMVFNYDEIEAKNKKLVEKNTQISIHAEKIMAGYDEHIAKVEAENKKLNLILFHRENGLAHPDLQGEIDKSKLAEENKLLKELLRQCVWAFSATCPTSQAQKLIEAVRQALKD